MSEVWHKILTSDAPCWVAFEADHCVLLPHPGPDPAAQAKKRLLEAGREGEIAEHREGYLFITRDVLTLVRREEVGAPEQVREMALRKRQNSRVSHVQPCLPVRRLSELILRHAQQDRIEAINLESTAQGGQVRFLSQGNWLTVMQPPGGFIPKLIQHWRPRGLTTSQSPWGECATLTLR